MRRYTVLFSILLMIGCGGCDDKKPLQEVKIVEEAKNIEVKFMRFDDDLFNADLAGSDSACQQLYHKYGGFYCSFIENDLRLAACQSDSVGQLIQPFINNRDIKETRKAIQTIFTEEKFSTLNGELTSCIQHWKHYFPDSLAPSIIYYQSAWNSNIAAYDSVIGISLDTYLGADHKITKQLTPEMFPNYKKENMDSKFIVADAMKGWVAWKARSYYEQKDLLSELVFYGKLMYIAEALAPDQPDSIMMSWSASQIDWALKNEWNTWKVLANEKVMFQTKSFEINKWFADGPFTGATGIPQDSPPQLGVWIGWNIVRQYMEKNPTLSLQQLLEEKDYQKILSAYTPRR
jgi:uncharacterized protein YjaZ